MPSSPMSTVRALAAVALLPTLAACQDQAISAIAKPERPVQVQRVAFQSEDATGEFVGVVRARYETDLGFRVAGKITDRVVNHGFRPTPHMFFYHVNLGFPLLDEGARVLAPIEDVVFAAHAASPYIGLARPDGCPRYHPSYHPKMPVSAGRYGT